MRHYIYRAIDSKGKLSNGAISAENKDIATQELRARALTLVSLQEQGAKRSFSLLSIKRKLKPKELLLFTRQLHSFYEANIPVKQAIQGIISHNDINSLEDSCHSINQSLTEGQSLSAALHDSKAGFGELYIAQIKAGERSGKMTQILEALGNHLEEQISQSHKIRMASLYPIILCIVAVAIVGLLLSTVVPKLVQQLEGKADLPMLTQIMIKLSELSQDYGPALILAFIAVFGLKRVFLKQQQWRLSIAAQLPITRELLRQNDASRYLSTIAVLYKAGIPIADAATSSARLIKSPDYKEALSAAEQQLKSGQRLSEFLQSSQLLSPNSLLLISNGEQSGRLAQMLEKAAREEKQDLNNSIEIALAVLEPALITIVGGIVFLIVLAILLPLMQMNTLVG
ncbi:type II secretion system F family protein [uncultured Pseudoteredinibacter sp.]|uniref:type II secretion system F family protein n=1 Tax=uncultured Pseudoteredinibacter sp. TaxID=1641701 RepID=UPI002611DD4E|nr:type II secretion system F family protein [uncultured Pseudoteredinibacter sp.]